MREAPKVVWITERFPPDRGGVASSSGRQVALLARLCERIDVLHLVSDLPPGFVATDVRGLVRVHRVGKAARGEESLQILTSVAERLLRRDRHDLVVGFGAVHSGYIAAYLGRLTGTPSIVSLRGNDVDRAMFHGPRLPFLRYALQEATAIYGVSTEILRKGSALVGRSEGFSFLANSVDGERFRPACDDEEDSIPEWRDYPRPWVAFSGEARFKKGLPILLELAGAIGRRGGTLFLMGGVRKEERDGFQRELAGDEIVRGATVVVPYEHDPDRLALQLRGVDLCVFPSLWDGMPNALLEAMATGRPVVAAAVGGIVDLVEDGVTGRLVESWEMHRFVDVVLESLDDTEFLRTTGVEARREVLENYTPAREQADWLALMQSVVQRGAST